VVGSTTSAGDCFLTAFAISGRLQDSCATPAPCPRLVPGTTGSMVDDLGILCRMTFSISTSRTFALLRIFHYRRRHGDRGPPAAPGPAADRGGVPRRPGAHHQCPV